MSSKLRQAPELNIQKWLNSDKDLLLEELRGKVVAIFAFQMLCPGCVERSIPQARNIHAALSGDDLVVIGLHTVFEHHEAMKEESLKAFMYEYRIDFPVGIDIPSSDQGYPIPKTMRNYNMMGTPTLILVDRQGRLRKQKMGHEHDLILGAELMALMKENTTTPTIVEIEENQSGFCAIDGICR